MEPMSRVVDTSVIPGHGFIFLNGLASPDDSENYGGFDLLSVASPSAGRPVTFGPFLALIRTRAFNPAITMEWQATEPPMVLSAEVRGEGIMEVPDHFVTISETNSGFLGQVPLDVPTDTARVRVNALDTDGDEVLVIQLWPT